MARVQSTANKVSLHDIQEKKDLILYLRVAPQSPIQAHIRLGEITQECCPSGEALVHVEKHLCSILIANVGKHCDLAGIESLAFDS
jgi:hypothetical protein